MTENKNYYAECPHCGAQYHLSEIFYPEEIMAKPHYIDKDKDGKIIKVVGTPETYTETYTCDYCGNSFSVTMSVRLKIKKIADINMREDYVTRYYKSENLFSEE